MKKKNQLKEILSLIVKYVYKNYEDYEFYIESKICVCCLKKIERENCDIHFECGCQYCLPCKIHIYDKNKIPLQCVKCNYYYFLK